MEICHLKIGLTTGYSNIKLTRGSCKANTDGDDLRLFIKKFGFFGGFRCGVPLFIVILVIIY